MVFHVEDRVDLGRRVQGRHGLQQVSWVDGAAISPASLSPEKRQGIFAEGRYDRKETQLLQEAFKKRG